MAAELPGELLGAARERGALARVAGELGAFARVLGGQPRLRRVLIDPSVEAGRKRALLGELAGGRLDPTTVDLLATLPERERLGSGEVVDHVAWLSALVTFADAEAAGELEAVERELFAVAVMVSSERSLRGALSDPQIPTANKQALLADLLEGRAGERARGIVRLLVDLFAGRHLDRWCRRLSERAAALRDRAIADVRTAVPLDDDRRERLATALARIAGKPVELRVRVDESILGSVVVRLGDEVLDGSVRHRLEQARAQLGVA